MNAISPLAEAAAEPLVLMIDDDVALAEETAELFRRYGFRVDLAPGWDEGMATIRARQPDAILLDQHLAGIDAVARIPLLRRVTAAPILVVTGNGEVLDRIVGLEGGADDFLVKPVLGRELVARVRAALRRGVAPRREERRGGWLLDMTTLFLTAPDGRQIRLKLAECELLATLMAAEGRPVSRDHLSQAVRGRCWRADGRSIDNAIVMLRRKLGQGRDDGPIRTLPRRGYAFATGFRGVMSA